jgi:hypothetical protein
MTLPTLNTKTKIIGAVVLLAIAFASGRYSVQSPTVKLKESLVAVTQTNTEKTDHKKVVIDKKPDGEVTTTITDDTATDTQKTSDVTTKVSETITPSKVGTLNISALGALDFSSRLPVPTYGLSITKEVLGPVTVGAFGLMNGVAGVSVGISF